MSVNVATMKVKIERFAHGFESVGGTCFEVFVERKTRGNGRTVEQLFTVKIQTKMECGEKEPYRFKKKDAPKDE